MTRRDNAFFWFVFTIVLMVSSVDLYLLIRYERVIMDTEENALGRWLIKMDSGSIALFSALKMFGTCLSLMIYKKIFLASRKLGYTVGSFVLAFQVWLFCYLLFP